MATTIHRRTIDPATISHGHGNAGHEDTGHEDTGRLIVTSCIHPPSQGASRVLEPRSDAQKRLTPLL